MEFVLIARVLLATLLQLLGIAAKYVEMAFCWIFNAMMGTQMTEMGALKTV